MTKKTKIGLATGIQLGMIASIGDYVGWPYMKYVIIAAGIAFAFTFFAFIYDAIKE
jgi:hypothetical protein